MLRFPQFRFRDLEIPCFGNHISSLTSWQITFFLSNIIMCIFVMIAVKKSERKPYLCDIHVNHPTTSYLYYGLPLPPNRGGKHILYLLLNCLTSSMAGTKSRRETCILKRSFAQSSFIMYIYANDILDYSRKSPSLLLLLPFGQSLRPAICTESGSRQSP